MCGMMSERCKRACERSGGVGLCFGHCRLPWFCPPPFFAVASPRPPDRHFFSGLGSPTGALEGRPPVLGPLARRLLPRPGHDAVAGRLGVPRRLRPGPDARPGRFYHRGRGHRGAAGPPGWPATVGNAPLPRATASCCCPLPSGLALCGFSNK